MPGADMSVLQDILVKAVEGGASDVHLKSGESPFFRVRGDLVKSEFPAMSAEELKRALLDILPEHIRDKSANETEIDFSHYEEGAGRFRVNVFLGSNRPNLAFRHVKTKIPSVNQLHLPPILEKLADSNAGVIMVCGATSSGKSTTLAAMIHSINSSKNYRIITIEDPIEYVFEDIKSVITQREVGLDTPSFHSALRHVLRQDPDVIMIGEMRDRISLEVALNAAETGHIVFSTLHANTAAQSVQRILNFYTAEEREQIRYSLAANLAAIICQRLIPAAAGGMRPAVEILINTPTVHKLLIENKLETLQDAIETGVDDGMQSFNRALYEMIKAGIITEKDGMDYSPNPEALKMNLQGIFLSQDRRILGG